MRTSRITALICAVAALTLTSGCGQNASAGSANPSISLNTATPSSSSTPTTSSALSTKTAPKPSASSPVPVVVTIPDAAKAHTQAGAVAFVKYYYETMERLEQEPTVGILPQLSAPTCDTCVEHEKMVSRDVKVGAKRKFQGETVISATVSPKSVPEQVIMVTTHKVPGYTYTDSSSSSPETYSAETINAAVRADWTSTGWRIGAIGERIG